jgi:TonB-linked SusC/RagA family outer membrane protein
MEKHLFSTPPRRVRVFNCICWLLLALGLQVSLPAFAQTKKITGTVRSSTGEPLPTASITIKGKMEGTSTDKDGKFTLENVDEKTVLQISLIGFAAKEVTVGTRSIIDVEMIEQKSELDQVVVVGYGTQKKRDVTGAISSISAKTIEEKQPVTLFDAIQGAAPGVRVMTSSGAPGEESAITIRGLSTLSDGGIKPLYIVDGVPLRSIGAINPKDIQSIEILKDAASAAIYGSRSANGVIIITTKRGEEGKPQINVDYLRSYSKLSNRISQANRQERVLFDRRGNLGLDEKRDDSTSFNRNSDNDYQDLITQTALRNQVDVGIRGGTKVLNYYNSLQYLDETGIVISSYNKRFTLRTNVEYNPSKRFTMYTRLNFSYQKRNNINEGNVIQQSLQRPPGMAMYFPNGEYIYFNGGRRNPLAEAYLRSNESKIYKGVLYQGFDFKIFDPLTLHADASADIELNRRSLFSSKFLSSNLISTGEDETQIPIRLQGNLYASYKQTFNSVHNVTALVGMNVEKNRLEEVNLEGSDFVTEAVTTLNAAGVFSQSDLYTRAGASSLLGFYGRLGYDYKGRYLVNATIRRDGSSVFGPENRWGNFPSVSVGWRFSDEAFANGLLGVLTDGKIRASWGITGNQEIGNYDAYQQFQFGSYFYNGVSGVRTSPRMGNAALKWEQTKQSDIGLDLTFLNGMISFTGDYYIKTTTDLLYDDPLPNELGFPDKVRTNLGTIENRGIELMLTATPVRTNNFSWQTSVNWSLVRNRIVSIPTDYIDDIWSVEQGKEAGNFYGYRFMGIYEYDESNAYTEDYANRLIPQFQKDAQGNVIIGKSMKPTLLGYTYSDGTAYTGPVKQMTTGGVISRGGDVIWENLPDPFKNDARDGNIGNEDRQFLGYGQPRWSLGWSNNFNYKGLSLSFNVYGNFGNKVYNENRRNLASFSNSNTTPDAYFIYNMWKYPGQLTDTYRGGDKAADNMRRGGSQFLEDGAFIRLQSVRLGYLLPERISSKAAMRGLNVYVYGINLLTWTDYTGFDPEVGQNSVLKPGNDPGKYPRRREVGMGLNITF